MTREADTIISEAETRAREAETRARMSAKVSPSDTKALHISNTQKMLLHRADMLRDEANDLEVLAAALPGMLPEGAERALSHVFYKAHR